MRTHLLRRMGWVATLALASMVAAVGVAAAQPADPGLQSTFLLRSDGAAFVYKDGVKYPVEVAPLGDDDIDAIPSGPAKALSALFATSGPVLVAPAPAASAPAAFPPPTPPVSLVPMPHRILPAAMSSTQDPSILSKVEFTSLGIERVEGLHFIWHLQMTNHYGSALTLLPTNATLLTTDGATQYAAFEVPSFKLEPEGRKDLPLMFTAPNGPGTRYRLAVRSGPSVIYGWVNWEPWDVSLG